MKLIRWINRIEVSEKVGNWFVWGLLVAILGYRSWILLDPDFGWHLKMGELVSRFGIPMTDPFSYTMASFPFVDHEWLTNVFVYQIYLRFGYGGLVVVFALIALVVVYLLKKQAGGEWHLIVLISGILLFDFAGVRPQVISWLFFALLWGWKSKSGFRHNYVLPLFFLLWTNLHGSFPIGLAVWAVLIATQFWESKKVDWMEVAWWTASVLITLINPYGWRLWGEVVMQMTDGKLRWSISEWMPYLVNGQIGAFFLVALGMAGIWRFGSPSPPTGGYGRKSKVRMSLGMMVVWIATLIEGLLGARYMPYWLIVNVTVWRIFWEGFEAELKAKRLENGLVLARRWLVIIGLPFALIGLVFALPNFTYYSLNGGYYPRMAVEFMKNNPVAGNIYNEYGWGGYLIWQYPEKKVFIDGRMPSWRYGSDSGMVAKLLPKKERLSAKESEYIFDEYRKMTRSTFHLGKTLRKYGITEVLIPPTKKLKPGSFGKWLEKQISGNKRESFDWEKALAANGFIKAYEDRTAVLWRLKAK